MNKDFWKKVYKDKDVPREHSTFSEFCLTSIKGDAVDLGCGNGRDLYYFRSKGINMFGVDAANENLFILKEDVDRFIHENPSPTNVYTRFFWHAIERELQLKILDWVKGVLFIEARTTKDKPKNVVGKHSRVLVDTAQLKRDLEERDYEIQHFSQGRGLSMYKGEDPHLVRVIAKKR